jgi:hypothetical protein
VVSHVCVFDMHMLNAIAGSYSTVWKGIDRDTRRVWAIKEMQKGSVKKEVCVCVLLVCMCIRVCVCVVFGLY